MGTELAATPAVIDPELRARWVAEYGEATATTLETAHRAADEARRRVRPKNTTRTYERNWKVWVRFTTAHNLPLLHGDQGTLTMFVLWAYARGKEDGTGYAPATVDAHLTAAVVGLRERGAEVTEEAAAFAREVLTGHAVQLAQRGDIRGRGKADPATMDGLRQIAASTPDTLAGARDLALVLLSFHFAARASEPAGLLTLDVQAQPEGVVVNIRHAKTKHSIRKAPIPFAGEPAICPVRAWHRWRDRLAQEAGTQYTSPHSPAFREIDRWGHVGDGLGPEGVSRAIARVAKRSGVPVKWTGHSLRAGLATEARRNGKDAKAIAAQGGWAPNSPVMQGYMHLADQWQDNASAGLR